MEQIAIRYFIRRQIHEGNHCRELLTSWLIYNRRSSWQNLLLPVQYGKIVFVMSWLCFELINFNFDSLGIVGNWSLLLFSFFFSFFSFHEAEANFQFIDILDRSINFIVRRRCMNHALHESMNEWLVSLEDYSNRF